MAGRAAATHSVIMVTVSEPKVVRKTIRHRQDGIDVVGDINAVIAVNEGGEGRSVTSVTSSQRIVQRSGRSRKQRGGATDAGGRAPDEGGRGDG